MSLLKTLKYWLTPLKMTDLDFGTLTFIYVSQNPERSYWECEWRFPSTGTVVLITLDGDESLRTGRGDSVFTIFVIRWQRRW